MKIILFEILFECILVISIGGIIFIVVRKIPVLLTLPEKPIAVAKESKAFRQRIKELAIAKHRELFSMESRRAEEGKAEDETTRQEEFETQGDYWQKVKGR